MKNILFRFLPILILVSGLLQTSYANNKLSEIQVEKNLASMSLSFTENKGQWDEKVKFRANAGGATMWFGPDGAYYQFTRTIKSEDAKTDLTTLESINKLPELYEIMMIKASFVGANTNPTMVGIDLMEYKTNYFIGNNKSKWVTDVPNYNAVLYKEIYDGIDLKYYGNGKQMEYDFIVQPGADFSQIIIQYEGAESVTVNAKGELVVATKWGKVVERRPVIYQVDNNSRIPIDGKYILQSDNSFSFELKNYNPALPLVIDPVISYSTYIGGSGNDEAFGIAVDSSGSMYIIGSTTSNDFPTFNPYTGLYQGGDYDVFITKLSISGNSLIYSTYLGGSGSIGDFGNSIVVDSFGTVYVTGRTYSSDFPTVNPYQASNHSGAFRADLFVTKLNSTGNSLIYSTYLGGSDNDEGWSIDVNQFGEIYIAGRTSSINFPITKSFQETYQGGSWDAFVIKFNSAGDSLIFSTYLGGNNNDGLVGSNGIKVDVKGSVYVMGYTESTNFPTLNPYQETNNGDFDVFVSKLNKTGDSLIYSTYLGGNDFDGFWGGLTLDTHGNAYLMGATSSIDFPTLNPYQGTYQGGNSDIFVTKLSISGDDLIYSTFLGGDGFEDGFGIEVDSLGYAYIIGRTASTNFPILNPYQETNNGGVDIYFTKLSSSGNNLIYSTYIGGSKNDFCYASTIDASGSVYFTGTTNSFDFPTLNPYQDTIQGGWDSFILKFSPDIPTDVEEVDIDNLPTDFNMSQNYPNPFNPTTTIEFNLPTRSNVTINIYNLLGQEVQQLVNQKYSAGNYRVTWDGTSSNGVQTSTGIYFYRIATDDFVETKKMLLLK